MPWCVQCDRFLSPSTVRVDGTCPRCGAPVDPGAGRSGASPAPEAASSPRVTAAPESANGRTPDDEEPLALPWHFKLLVGAIALYLGWRVVQGVEWLLRQL